MKKAAGWSVSVMELTKKGDKLSWEGGLYALQKLQDLPVHVGGRTALEQQGYSHYGRMSGNQVILWKRPRVRLPRWFQDYDWTADINVRTGHTGVLV